MPTAKSLSLAQDDEDDDDEDDFQADSFLQMFLYWSWLLGWMDNNDDRKFIEWNYKMFDTETMWNVDVGQLERQGDKEVLFEWVLQEATGHWAWRRTGVKRSQKWWLEHRDAKSG